MALHYIRRQQGRGISVSDVAAEVALSRRSLETRFRKTIGRTVFDEIRRARLEHARQLLLETGHPVSMVATMAGFESVSHFIAQFRQHVGMTPGKFRDTASP
jgi:LacI family transcriptional regulator